MKHIATMALMLNLGVASALRTRAARKDDVFGQRRAQPGQPRATQFD